jgi:putative oxidoreductase
MIAITAILLTAITRRPIMTTFGADRIKDEVVLAARILLVVLFLIFGWSKLTHYTGTVGFLAHTGVPLPPLAAIVAIAVEFFVSVAIVLGVLTRPLAVLMAVYTLATAFLGHHYWTMTGTAHLESEINFYKNVSIIAGFLLLYVTGAGRYSLDALLGAEPGATLRSV